MFTRAWLANLVQHIILAASTTFFGLMVEAGLNWWSVTAVHAALAATGAAVFVTIQGALAAVVSPPLSDTALILRAIGQRALYSAQQRALRAPKADTALLARPSVADPPPLTREDLVEAISYALIRARNTESSPPPPGAPPPSVS